MNILHTFAKDMYLYEVEALSTTYEDLIHSWTNTNLSCTNPETNPLQVQHKESESLGLDLGLGQNTFIRFQVNLKLAMD